MNNTTVSSSINFALLNQSINRYAPIPLLFLGAIGNILNILVFTRKIFRHNICVTYFLASTVFDSIVIISGLFPRLLSGFRIDLSRTSAILCKLRFFTTYFTGYAAAWFISLACVERYLSSSPNVHRRQLITMQRVYLSIILVLAMGFVCFGEHFYCIDINQHLLGAPQSCYQLQQSIQCQVIDSLMQFIFEMLGPALMMLIFGVLTFLNVRQRHRRTNIVQANHVLTVGQPPSAPQQVKNITVGSRRQILSMPANRTAQKRETQLLRMLFLQVVIFVIFTFPIGVFKLYSLATIYGRKSILQISIENTIFNVSVISLFVNNCITFYLNTLSGTVFRKELLKLFRFTRTG